MNTTIKRIAILTGGGDCPGLNAVIRAVTSIGTHGYGLEVIGIRNGYRGLYERDFFTLDSERVSGILHRGGTILYSSNKDNLFKYPFEENGQVVYKDVSDVGIANLQDAGIDALVVVGGDGTLTSARDFARKGVKVVAVPKTIDNDLDCTEYTFGYDTAVDVATEALDRLHTTAESHHRIMCLEVMGRYAGWIALQAGLAGGADAILIPEIPYDIDVVAERLKTRRAAGKEFSVVVVAEGAKPLAGEMVVREVVAGSPDPLRLGGIGAKVAHDLEARVGLESRATILGHLQRGGTPSAFDRVLATRYGVAAVELLMQGKFGKMVTIRSSKMAYDKLEHVIGHLKNVDPQGELVQTAKKIGVTFGDRDEA